MELRNARLAMSRALQALSPEGGGALAFTRGPVTLILALIKEVVVTVTTTIKKTATST